MSTTKPVDILFESGEYFIVRVDKGFEVFKMGVCAATRCANIGYKGDEGLQRAKQEIIRRQGPATHSLL